MPSGLGSTAFFLPFADLEPSRASITKQSAPPNMLMFYRLLLLLLVVSLPLDHLSAQKGKDKEDDKEWLEDPYSENDKDILAAAGIVKEGRFHWADNHSTADIDEALGGARIRWVETAHFRIGSSLGNYTIDKGSKTEKEKIRQEIKRLRERLPNVPKKVKKLDPWLRLHLYAMRAEDLYAEISDLLGVTDESFPISPDLKVNGEYMGEGAYLGMKSKFTLLFFKQESSLGRYRKSFMNAQGDEPIRYMFPRDGSLLFGIAAENDGMASDTTMHCLFVYSLSMNLLNGYRYYRHAMPEWVTTGLGHWFARRIDPTKNYFTKDRLFGTDDKNIWKWRPKVRARIGHDYYPAFTEVLNFKSSEEMKYNEHMMAWSRVDFLMHTRRDGFAKFFKMVKEPFPAGVYPAAEEMIAVQEKALMQAFQLDAASYDEAWAAWCLKNYPKK